MATNPHTSLEGQLLRLFEAVRQEPGISLGMREYMDLIRAVNAGFLVRDIAELRRLCLLLWAKSQEQASVIGSQFDRMAEQILGEVDETGRLKPSELPENKAKPMDTPVKPAPGEDKFQSTPPDKPSERSSAVPKTHPLAAEVPQAPVVRRRFLLRRVPVSDRQRAQSWRKLRRMDRVGARVDLDLDATMEDMARQGILLDIHYQKALENVAQLHFLVDREGSMVPFHGLCRSLVRGARNEGEQLFLEVRYFHDWPQGQVFRQELLSEPEDLGEWLAGLDAKRSLVVILSDAGAARGNLDRHRIRQTEEFLRRLRRSCRRVAWLNPLVPTRWAGTSAEQIAGFVPMFSVHGKGIDHAVDYLRGKASSPILKQHSSYI